MLSKEQAKEFNQAFWGELHKRMRSQKSSNGRSIGWLNYPTDVKNTYLRLVAERHHVSVHYDIQFKDASIRAIFWEQLTEMKKVMENTMEICGTWQEVAYSSEGQEIGRVSWTLEEVNYYNEKDHEKIYAFFMDTLTRFDLFYQEFKEILITLVH